MGSVSFSRLAVVLVVAFATGFAATISDGFSSFAGGDFASLGKAIEASAARAVAVGLSASLTAAVGFFTVPFKGLGANALEYTKGSK